MFTGITTRAGSLVTAIVVLTGAAILRGGAAAADSDQDGQFLALLSQQGIPAVSGIPALVNTAHEVCADLAGGMSADGVVDALVDNANNVTPGADPGRLRRTETRFVIAAVGAYCPGSNLPFTNPAGSNGTHRLVLASFIEGATPVVPPPTLPVPDVKPLKPPHAVAPPVVGPPPSGSAGGGDNGGGTGGVTTKPPGGPGIITLAP